MATFLLFGDLFLITFLDMSIFFLNCMKECFMGLGFFLPFFVGRKLDFYLVPVNSSRTHRGILNMYLLTFTSRQLTGYSHRHNSTHLYSHNFSNVLVTMRVYLV
jgi:hypothetical protein